MNNNPSELPGSVAKLCVITAVERGAFSQIGGMSILSGISTHTLLLSHSPIPAPSPPHLHSDRVCEDCFINVSDEEKKPRANFFDTKHIVRHLSYDPSRQLLATVGHDHVIKVGVVGVGEEVGAG